MKDKLHFSKIGGLLLGSVVLVTAGATLVSNNGKSKNFAAHEWGTFTSVQGADGILMEWQPLETSQLPDFVHNWLRPGPGRVPNLAKNVMFSLQRMETPVIYFYSAHPQTVDVSVRFPQGRITEWYPQAAEVAPGTLSPLQTPATAENCLPGTDTGKQTQPESRMVWKGINIKPERANHELVRSLPYGSSGNHYFAARETDSDYVSTRAGANDSVEHEKFIFYRGVGNFGTPLRVTMNTDDTAVIENTGKQPLEHLFVLQLRDRFGNFHYIERLEPGEQRPVSLNSSSERIPVDKLSRDLGNRMSKSLVAQGLYAREATAMVHTWKDSWFQEDGLRVLYILPRQWTDGTLPLEIKPVPGELVRVMVGRAEVISPQVQKTLATSLAKSDQGDVQAREIAVGELKRLGRFAEPAIRLVTQKKSPEDKQSAWLLLRAAAEKRDKAAL